MSINQVDSILDEGNEKKSSELAYLDRVALVGFGTLGTVFFIILALAIYLNLG
jgi:hypothetical protein